MKWITVAVLIFGGFLLFPGCQKNLDLNPDGISVGTLKDTATGACLPVVVNGLFRVDSVLTSENYVDVQVNVAIAGSFEVKSDTVNGYSFKKTGTVGTGLNVIRLYASGQPLAAGTNTFFITYGLSSCSFTITVYGSGSGSGTALYTLGGAPGNCSVSTINGNYVVGQAMNAGNSVEMTVNVTAVGTYNITGPVINGVSFGASGTFTNPGIQNIFLAATGTPVTAGLFDYPVTNTTTSCNFPITYTLVITNANYTLSGSPGNCTSAALTGTYTAGTPLNASNTAVINVTVTSPGLYTITTPTVNGISFSASGTFNITGTQQVILNGTGTPTVNGIFNFPLTGGGNTCNFSVNCGGTPPVGNIDYIPQTNFSNWSFREVGGGPDDTSYIHVLPTPFVIGPNTYKIFETVNSINYPGVPKDSFYYRKNGGLYYYIFNDSYYFDGGFNTEGLLLDSTAAVNAFWIIILGNDTWGGLPATGSIKATILAKGASAVIAGNNYNNIIKVEYVFRYNTGAGEVDYNRWEMWFARGIGNVYFKSNRIPVTTISENEVFRQQVF